MTWSLSPTTSKNKLQKTDRLTLPVGFFSIPPDFAFAVSVIARKTKGRNPSARLGVVLFVANTTKSEGGP